MQGKPATFRALRGHLLARASALAMRVALRPCGWAWGLLGTGLIGAAAPALAQELIDLATETADVEIQGAAAGDATGHSIGGAGDINGDGVDDLFIGASRADPNNRDGAGATYVIFGSKQGFSDTIDLADAIAGADVVIQGAAAGDDSGYSVGGAGDINGDGVDDLIVGARGADPKGRSHAGASYVIFGNKQGLSDTIDLADAGNGADVVIQGAAGSSSFDPGDSSGSSVGGAGDINGDGTDDLIIGAPISDPNGRDLAGASYVILGNKQGFPDTIDLADAMNGADIVIQGAVADGRFGYSVSGAGDINGDGVDDLIIGAHRADVDGRTAAGTSYVIFGDKQGFPNTIDLADAINGADIVIQGAAAFDEAGHSVSGAGDINGDGVDDLTIGAPGADPIEPGVSYGASYVIFGRKQGFPHTIDLADAINGADIVIQGAARGDNTGVSVSGAGDITGDGVDDLIIGAPSADPKHRNSAGASYVIFGNKQGFPHTIDLADAINGADIVIQGAMGSSPGSPGDLLGVAVGGIGDVNDDGIDDLKIGATGADPNGRSAAGAGYVLLGGPAAAIERLIDRVEAADLSRGIENSLTSKLNSALGHLARDQTTGATGKVGGFINQVGAQSGKQIGEADADAWIAAAETILDMLTTS